MNHKQKFTEDQMKECRERWFKDHVAVWLDKPQTGNLHNGATVISWQNPKSWNYGCRFIIHRRWLCVVGDIGEATFEWSEDLTLEFLAGCDFHYLMGKCEASPEGKKFESFDPHVAELYRVERLAELKATPEDDKGEDDAKEIEVLEDFSQGGKEEYDNAARDYYDETGDAEGAGEISEMGIVPSVHAIGMFVGLQMAIQQLKEVK